MSGMGEPDQIDMMTEQELRVELRGVLVDLGRMATDRAQLQYALEQSEQAFIEQRSKLDHYRDLTSLGVQLCTAPDWSNDGTPTRGEIAKQFMAKYNEKVPA